MPELPERRTQPGSLDGCPYRYVDRAPHHYRVQGWRWEADDPSGCWLRNADELAETAAGAELVRARLVARGYQQVSVLAPTCDGRHGEVGR